MAALRAYDEDGNGTLDEKEFEAFARNMINTGPDAFFARVGKHAVVQTAVLPAAAVAVQKAIPNSPVCGWGWLCGVCCTCVVGISVYHVY